MIPAFRSIGPARKAAAPMPYREELKPFYDYGVTFRHGQVVMLAGFPGSQKSGLAMHLANVWNLPTLYLSCDMSHHDTITRLGGMRANATSEEVSRALADDTSFGSFVEDQLVESQIGFVFDDGPTLDDIEEELSAYVEMYDRYPSVLVIDNLIDLDLDGEDEYKAWRQALLWFKGLARDTGIFILVIHHARELGKSDYPAPRTDISGKVSQTPEISISVALTPGNLFRAAIVKNRNGQQDAQAREGLEFQAHPAKTQFRYVGRFVAPEKRRS